MRVYSKVVGENGQKFIFFQDLTVALDNQNATYIGDTIQQVNFDNLNELHTKVNQVALVANNIEPRYKATVIKTLVSGISNLTNMTISDATAEGADTKLSQRFTIVKSLALVTNLIRGDPEIIGVKEKDMLKNVLNTVIGLDDSDNEYFASELLDNNSPGSQSSRTTNPTQMLANNGSQEYPILTDAVMIRDTGRRESAKVEKYDQATAQQMIMVCDDLFRAETVSNRSDPELKRMAVTGIKKVLSGAVNEISNSFSYESSTVKARAQLYVAGKDSPNSKTVQI